MSELKELSELSVVRNTGQYVVPKALLEEHKLTTGDIGELILEAWRAHGQKGHSNSLTISSYYWTEKQAFVISWRPGIVGRTG